MRIIIGAAILIILAIIIFSIVKATNKSWKLWTTSATIRDVIPTYSSERLGLRCCIYAFYNTSLPMKRGYICLLLHRVWTVLFSLRLFLLKPCILPVFLIPNRKCPIERGADPTSTLEYMTINIWICSWWSSATITCHPVNLKRTPSFLTT